MTVTAKSRQPDDCDGAGRQEGRDKALPLQTSSARPSAGHGSCHEWQLLRRNAELIAEWFGRRIERLIERGAMTFSDRDTAGPSSAVGC